MAENEQQRSWELNCVRTGPRGATPVILIHPVGLDLTYWGSQINALRTDHDVVAFDLPGHGSSHGKPDDRSIPRAVSFLEEVVANTGTPVTTRSATHRFTFQSPRRATVSGSCHNRQACFCSKQLYRNRAHSARSPMITIAFSVTATHLQRMESRQSVIAGSTRFSPHGLPVHLSCPLRCKSSSIGPTAA